MDKKVYFSMALSENKLINSSSCVDGEAYRQVQETLK